MLPVVTPFWLPSVSFLLRAFSVRAATRTGLFSRTFATTLPPLQSSPVTKDPPTLMNAMTTMAEPEKIQKSNPFAPSSKTISQSSASQSSRPVTLPHLPELYQPLEQVLNTLFPDATPSKAAKPAHPESQQIPSTSSPFMDALKVASNRTATDNDAAAYKSTLSPTLDAFASLSQSTSSQDIAQLLTDSWMSDPEVTLRIIWNIRSIHDGKSAREPFYRVFAWLYEKHPKTAVANLRYLVERRVKRTFKKKPKKVQAEDGMGIVTMEDPAGDEMQVDPKKEELTIYMPHGYWKDLLNILLLATTDQLRPDSSFSALHVRLERSNTFESTEGPGCEVDTPSANDERESPEQRAEAARARDKVKAAEAKESRHQRYKGWNDTVERKLEKDTSFRALYITIARLFADALARDIRILREISDERTNAERIISLAYELTLVGKWAPSIGGSHDRVTSIATPIAELLHAEGHLLPPALPLKQPLSTEVAHKLRSAYTRWVTSPLRRFIQIPEVAMSAREWDKIKYTRVPSKCMQMNKTHFYKHDKERFSQFLLDVTKGKKKISGATLLPHELLCEAMSLTRQATRARKKHNEPDAGVAEIQIQVVESQWKTMVERVKESGMLDNALAVCDVSGSMGSLYSAHSTQPIFASVALSIVLAQVSRLPWTNHFITFSEHPEIISFNPHDGLVTAANKIYNTDWGMNTDFNAVFTKLILPMAVENKIKPEDMVKRLFVFSDMQFDNSRVNDKWETEHNIIKKKFEAVGYEVPELVYWNLSGSVSKPITKDEEGVVLVSGFSPGMLKVFLEGGSFGAEDQIQVETKVGEDGEYVQVTKAEKKRLAAVETMLKALDKESFSGLVVMD